MSCLICLRDAGGELYHSKCARQVFGRNAVPSLDLDQAKLQTLALAMAGRATLTGVQRKISLGISVGRGAALHVVGEGGSFILKPQASGFPNVPENEHLTMRMAEAFGIETALCALVRMEDGSFAYLVRRFDRTLDGKKRRQEDFCQLAGLVSRQKYSGSAELCVRIVRRYAAEPLVQLLELYRRLIFIWWTGNGDMHLKNFSILIREDGVPRLSPAYDMLSTRLFLPKDDLALSIGGKRDRFTQKKWRELAAYMELPPSAAARVHRSVATSLDELLAIVGASPLPAADRAAYEKLLRRRAVELTRGH